jgi:hypothetical protein
VNVMLDIRVPIVTAGLTAMLATSTLAAEPPPPPTPHAPSALAGTSLTWCGDIVTPRAAPGLYRDSPIYIANEMPTDRIKRWARSRPGFVDVWIDREHNGWVNVMFTRDVSVRQAELARAFPGVGVVAVQVEHGRQELRRLARRVGSFVERWDIPAAYGSGNADNVVGLSLGVVTDELATALETEFAGAPLCIGGADPADLVRPGSQPRSGDGWVMLAWEQGHGPAHEVGIATDQASYERLWGRTQLDGSPPAMDFVSDVVVWFAEGHGSSCPNLRMDEVIVDRERSQVYPLIVYPDGPMLCTDDLAGAYQYVAALERTELPPGPFEIGLGGGDGELWSSVLVDADLTSPGAVAGPGDIGEPPPRYPRSGTTQEPFGSFTYAMDTDCGVGYLGVINDVHWVTRSDEIPTVWADGVEPDGDLIVQVRLRTEPGPHALVSYAGETVRYVPVARAPPACEG